MGHEYVKENETFNTSKNGVVPKPTASDVSNNKVLGASGSWITQSGGGGGGASSFSELEDVNFSNLQNSQVPKYNSSTQKWENADESGGEWHEYSTSEKVVGKWIDGKTIYEKTFINTQNMEMTADTWYKTEFSQGDMRKIIYCVMTNISYMAYNSELSAGWVDNMLAINSARTMTYAIGDCALTLQYTKATD